MKLGYSTSRRSLEGQRSGRRRRAIESRPNAPGRIGFEIKPGIYTLKRCRPVHGHNISTLNDIEHQCGMKENSNAVENSLCSRATLSYLCGLIRSANPLSASTDMALSSPEPKRGSHAIIERLPNRHTQVSGLCSKYIKTP